MFQKLGFSTIFFDKKKAFLQSKEKRNTLYVSVREAEIVVACVMHFKNTGARKDRNLFSTELLYNIHGHECFVLNYSEEVKCMMQDKWFCKFEKNNIIKYIRHSK